MRVIFKVPNKKAEILTINNDYKELQKLVGGYFEHIQIALNIGVYVNEEGKLQNLEPNLPLWNEDLELIDVLVGNIVIVQHSREYDVDMSDKNINKYMNMLKDGAIIKG